VFSHRICPVKSPYSRKLFQTYTAPGLDMSSQAALPVPSLGAPNVVQCLDRIPVSISRYARPLDRTCTDLWHPNGQILCGGYERGSPPPSLIWPLCWLEYPFNLSFLRSNSLPQASIKAKPSRRDLSQLLNGPLDLQAGALHQRSLCVCYSWGFIP
jgi:hypothetical protein